MVKLAPRPSPARQNMLPCLVSTGGGELRSGHAAEHAGKEGRIPHRALP